MDEWVKDTLRALGIGLGLGLAVYFGSLTRSAKQGDVETLQPTIFTKFLLYAFAAIFVFFLFVGWNETRPDQIRWWYFLLIGSVAACMWLYWYFHLRIIYWSDNGVGVSAPLIAGRFIPWNDVTWAGITLTGEHQIRSGGAKISFTQFNGGSDDLVAAVKRHVPPSIVTFD